MSEEIEAEKLKLTGKQKLFADYYVGECALNATRAARLAKYSGNDNAMAVIGSNLLRNIKVRAYIDEKLKDLIITPNEVLTILTRQAKSSLADVLDENGKFDLADAKRRGVDGLMKEIEIKEIVRKDLGSIQILERSYKYKIHDSQSAAVHVGKAHGIFTENINHGGEVGMKHSIDPQTIKDINEAYDGTAE